MEQINNSIQCSVKSCTYHADSKDYCTLNSIRVGCCGDARPKTCDCTECASFQSSGKNGCC